jgi:hypothetical protein
LCHDGAMIVLGFASLVHGGPFVRIGSAATVTQVSRYRAVAHYVICLLPFRKPIPHNTPSWSISAAAVAITNRYADLLGWHGFVPVDFSSSTGRVRFSRKREWPTTFYCMPHLLFKVAALLWYNMQSSSPATTSRVVVTTARSCIEVEVKVQFGSDE